METLIDNVIFSFSNLYDYLYVLSTIEQSEDDKYSFSVEFYNSPVRSSFEVEFTAVDSKEFPEIISDKLIKEYIENSINGKKNILGE